MDDAHHFSMEESIRACHAAGFGCFDLNFHVPATDNGPLTRDDWQDWVRSLAALREELGVSYPYAHTYFCVWPEPDEGDNEKLMERSIRAAGMLGVKWLAVHPYSACDEAWYSREASIAYNLRYMRRYAAIARDYPGMGLAIENMLEDRKKRRYGSCAEDLLELLYALDDPIFGLCWDFGHAERSNIDHTASLRQMGKHLKLLHVHDTNVDADHTLPFLGTTDWRRILPVLGEIGFEGEMNFEIHNYTRFLPHEARPAALRLAYEINQSLIAIVDAAKPQKEGDAHE